MLVNSLPPTIFLRYITLVGHYSIPYEYDITPHKARASRHVGTPSSMPLLSTGPGLVRQPRPCSHKWGMLGCAVQSGGEADFIAAVGSQVLRAYPDFMEMTRDTVPAEGSAGPSKGKDAQDKAAMVQLNREAFLTVLEAIGPAGDKAMIIQSAITAVSPWWRSGPHPPAGRGTCPPQRSPAPAPPRLLRLSGAPSRGNHRWQAPCTSV